MHVEFTVAVVCIACIRQAAARGGNYGANGWSHTTNACAGPMREGTDLESKLASGEWNVARGKTVAADSWGMDMALDNLVTNPSWATDGRSGPHHRWSSTTKTTGHYLIVDLGQEYWIEGVNVYAGDCEPGCESQCPANSGLCSFKVEVWSGGGESLAAVQNSHRRLGVTGGWVRLRPPLPSCFLSW